MGAVGMMSRGGEMEGCDRHGDVGVGDMGEWEGELGHGGHVHLGDMGCGQEDMEMGDMESRVMKGKGTWWAYLAG